MRGQFASALSAAFAQRGISLQDTATLVADYSVSQRSAELGIQHARDAQDASPGEAQWIDPPREPRRFDRCEAQELRGTLILVDRNSGEAVYRGTGAATECGFGEAAIRSLADGLVADYLAN